MNRKISPGSTAPDFELRAAGSGLRFSLRECLGRRVVLVFHQAGTARAAERINRAVRSRYPSSREVVVASVVDLSLVPPLYWTAVDFALRRAYGGAASALPPGVDPSEYVIILPDWDGMVSRRYGVRDAFRRATVAVVDAGSHLVDTYQGDEPASAALELLQRGDQTTELEGPPAT